LKEEGEKRKEEEKRQLEFEQKRKNILLRELLELEGKRKRADIENRNRYLSSINSYNSINSGGYYSRSSNLFTPASNRNSFTSPNYNYNNNSSVDSYSPPPLRCKPSSPLSKVRPSTTEYGNKKNDNLYPVEYDV
jgi:hypothetical protein